MDSLLSVVAGKSGEPARRMPADIYRDFEDPDGNFVEQFQTTGFNA